MVAVICEKQRLHSPSTSIMSLLKEAVWAILFLPPMELVSYMGILTGSCVIWWLMGLLSANVAERTAEAPLFCGLSALGGGLTSPSTAGCRALGRNSATGERGPGWALVLGGGRWPGLGAVGAVYTSE